MFYSSDKLEGKFASLFLESDMMLSSSSCSSIMFSDGFLGFGYSE